MFDFEINISDFISPSLREEGVERTLSTLNKLAEGLLDEQRLAELSWLSTDNTFQLAFSEALQRGADRFVGLYLDEDEDLVEAIVDHEGFFGHEQVQKGFLSILQEPSSYLADGQEVVIYSFDRVLPRRRNRRRVNRAMSVFLSCLAQDVWGLPQLRAAYDATALTPSPSPNIGRGEFSFLPTIAPEGTPDQPKPYHNLPQPDYERFVGRKAELAQLQKLLSPTDRHFVMTIDGIGGIGKSALALEVAHRYRGDFGKLPQTERFEAIIWATAKHSLLTGQGIITRSQSLRTLDDIYSTIATTLEREEITRARSQEQDDIVRRALTEQRTLLIIDNLETVDDERVMSFIRDVPAPTKVIVTTRHRVDVAYPIRLVGMSQSEALELIGDESKRKRVALTPNQATRLHKRTGGVPLAIVWSVAQMGFGHGIEATLTRLGQPTSDIAQFCFQGAINLIQNTPAHHLLMALSLFATDANRDALGYVADLPLLDRDEGLEELERLSLVNKEGARFALLPLTKVYSEEELAKEMGLEERFRERLVDWLLQFVTQKHAQKYNTVEDVTPELDNIVNVMDWCWSGEKINELLPFIRATDFYLWTNGNWGARTRYLELGCKVAERLSDELVQADFWRRLADDRDFRDDLGQATYFIEKAINIHKSYPPDYRYILSLFRLSAIQAKQKRYETALNTANKGLLIAKDIGHIKMIMRMEGRLAKIRIREGKYDLAKPHVIRAITLNKSQPKDKQENWYIAWFHRLLGQVLLAEEKYELANQHFQISLRISTQVSSTQEMAETNRRIAELKLVLADTDQAQQFALKALQMFTQMGMKRDTKETQALLDQIAAQRKHNQL
ncbi:MAG: NB-ARC domain-containing protein [Ardenticatenaceae bacterium]